MHLTHMTKQQMLDAFWAGSPILVVEYRSSRVDFIQWMDKATKQSLQAHLLRHTVEAGDKSFTVSERMPKDWTGEGYKPPFSKGTKCVLEFTSFKTERGITEASGKLLAIVDGKG